MEKQTHRFEQCLIHRKNSKNYGKTLAGSLERLGSYLSDYQNYFKNITKMFYDKAEEYSHRIFLSSERNIERICEANDDQAYHKMHHFISDSKWNARALID